MKDFIICTPSQILLIYKVLVRKPEARRLYGIPGLNGRAILKRILKE
jgi:hypothetical protein